MVNVLNGNIQVVPVVLLARFAPEYFMNLSIFGFLNSELEKSRNDDKNSVAVVSLLMKKCKFVLSLQSMPRANPTNYA